MVFPLKIKIEIRPGRKKRKMKIQEMPDTKEEKE